MKTKTVNDIKSDFNVFYYINDDVNETFKPLFDRVRKLKSYSLKDKMKCIDEICEIQEIFTFRITKGSIKYRNKKKGSCFFTELSTLINFVNIEVEKRINLMFEEVKSEIEQQSRNFIEKNKFLKLWKKRYDFMKNNMNILTYFNVKNELNDHIFKCYNIIVPENYDLLVKNFNNDEKFTIEINGVKMDVQVISVYLNENDSLSFNVVVLPNKINNYNYILGNYTLNEKVGRFIFEKQ